MTIKSDPGFVSNENQFCLSQTCCVMTYKGLLKEASQLPWKRRYVIRVYLFLFYFYFMDRLSNHNTLHVYEIPPPPLSLSLIELKKYKTVCLKNCFRELQVMQYVYSIFLQNIYIYINRMYLHVCMLFCFTFFSKRTSNMTSFLL